MTNEELLDIVKMLLDGCTLKEICDKYGVTAKFVRMEIRSISSIDSHVRRAGQKRMYDQIIYPNIRARMKEREWTIPTIADKTGISRMGLYHILYGDTQRPQIKSKAAIAKALDMSVDEAFRKEECNDA